MSLSTVGSDLVPPHDPDLLMAYRAAAAGAARDEFWTAPVPFRVHWQGNRRPGRRKKARLGWTGCAPLFEGLSTTTASPTREVDRPDDDACDEAGLVLPGQWHLDGLPLVVDADDWDKAGGG